MRHHNCALAAGLAIFLVAALATVQSAIAAPPVEAFGKRPMISDVVISPDGTHYAALQWVNGKEVIAIYNLYPRDERDRVKVLATDSSKKVEEKVLSLAWLNDDTLGVVFQWEGIRIGWMGSIPVSETRLVAMKADLSDMRQIPRPNKNSRAPGQLQHYIIDYLDEDPDHILMALNREGDSATLSVYRVNIHKGTFRRVVKGGPRVGGYMSDQESNLRLRWLFMETKAKVQHRGVDSREWLPLFEYDRTKGPKYSPQAFTANPDYLVVAHTGVNGFKELLKYDLASNRIVKTVYKVPGKDVSSVARDRYTRRITGYNVDDHHPGVAHDDRVLTGVQNVVDARLPDSDNTIMNYDRARDKFIVLASSVRNPGTYYLFLRSSGQFIKVQDRNALPLDPAALGDMKVIRYTARDGMEIPAYLTLPPGEQGPFPMVVMPHGGPTARNYLAYDYRVQFLVSRGYAVLQPQFRGSTGFGRSFRRAGYKQWGLLMQDDVTDGARAMIAQGIADPDRMCIVGGSYGGYAALMGAVVTPDLFQCAVSFAGVSDIDKMIAQHGRYKFAMDNPPNVGSRRDDRDQLRDTSPINNIDAIKAPVLLVHGEKDLSVNASHSERMARALKKARKPYKLVILEDGNHYLQLEQNRIRFLKELETFLGEHIGR